MLAHSRNCTECGAPVHNGAALGLCPACALRAALNLPAGSNELDLNKAQSNHLFGSDYELFEEIGRGGMGIVFRARQKSLNRIVALKVLSVGVFANPSGRKRLLSEAAAAARLRHPNIVAVHEAGELDGHAFYSMDYIEGRTLAEVVNTGPVPPNRAAAWLHKIAAAVHYAHSQNVLHRDLKPSNILLDGVDEPRITDFGLAKVLDSTESATLSGSIFGSPAYMPPEQATGRVGEIGPAGDVYSLGAILYELLTGRPPFQGGSPQGVIEQVKTVEPVAPRRLNAGVPVDLETVTSKCLEKDPAQRYSTAQELADELGRFLEGRPVKARPVNAIEKFWRWSRRRPLAASLAALSLILLFAVLVIVFVSAERIRASRDEARVRLAGSLLSESHALRLAAETGWRETSLRNLADAHREDQRGRLTFQLRNEALAALSRPDLARRMVTNVPPINNTMDACFDFAFQRVGLWNPLVGAVEIRRVSDGKLVATCKTAKPDEIHAFSYDDRFLLLRHGGAMSVWDAATGLVVLSANGSESHNRFNGGEFSPDGKKFGRGETNGEFAIYDLTSTTPLQLSRWPLPDGLACATVAWSAKGDEVALVLGPRTLAVCDANSGRVRWKRKYSEIIWNVTWNNARGWLVMQSGDDRVLILRPEDGSEVDHLNLPQTGTPIARLSPDGNFLAASGDRFGTEIFDAATRHKLAGDTAPAWHLHFDTSGSRLGSLLDQGQPLWLEWLPPLIQTTWHSPGQLDQSERVAFSDDGRRLVSLISSAAVVWDFATGEIVGEVDLRRARSAEFGPHNQQLFCISDKALFVVDLSGKKNDSEFIPRQLLASENLKSLAVAGDGTVAVVDYNRSSVFVLAGTNRSEISLPIDPLTIAFNPEGSWLACGSRYERDVYICRPKQPHLPPVRLADAGSSAVFSSDGKQLFTFGHDVRAWNTRDWSPEPPLPLHASGAEQIIGAVSRDGRWLAATQRDREVALVELATGRVVANLDGPGTGGILSLAFSPDGNTLVIARDRGDLQFWPLPALKAELGKLGLDW